MSWREGNGNLHCHSFSFVDLKSASRNFRPDFLLRDTDFGTFYKGWIDEETFAPSKPGTGMRVSIKKNSLSMLQIIEGQLELNIVEKLSHPNLVKCIGYCREDKHLLFLVYEFMERGYLDNHLFTSSGYSLSWNLRMKIAIGAARGLDFLHIEKNVIHRDIRPSVIMLDGNYNAKISGFELAIFGPSDGDSHVTTEDMENFGIDPASPGVVDTGYIDPAIVAAGVRAAGHIDPEYSRTGRCCVKSDVYSFGVVLLQLMTGLRALDKNRPRMQEKLADWSKPFLLQKKTLINIMDARIEGQYSSKAMILAANLCLKCLDREATSRPSMKEVVDSLQQIYNSD